MEFRMANDELRNKRIGRSSRIRGLFEDIARLDAQAAVDAFVLIDDRRGEAVLADGPGRAFGDGGAAVVLGAVFRMNDDHEILYL
jgi:hypothetical protein